MITVPKLASNPYLSCRSSLVTTRLSRAPSLGGFLNRKLSSTCLRSLQDYSTAFPADIREVECMHPGPRGLQVMALIFTAVVADKHTRGKHIQERTPRDKGYERPPESDGIRDTLRHPETPMGICTQCLWPHRMWPQLPPPGPTLYLQTPGLCRQWPVEAIPNC